MEKIPDRWLIAAGGGLCALLIGLNVQLMYGNTVRLYEHSGWVSHTREVLIGLDNVLSLMKDAETGQRGFLLTGEERYLEPYHAAVAAIDGEIRHVQELVVDNPVQVARLPELNGHVARKLELLAGSIAARRDRGLEAARQIVANDRGKQEMDALRVLVADMKREEDRLLEERSGEARRSYRWAISTGMLAGVLALGAVIAFVVMLQRHQLARTRAAAVLYNQRELLRVTLASIGDAIVTTDVAGRVTYLNAVAEALTGWKQAEAAGVGLETVFSIVNEETRSTVENPATRALREGTIVGLANHTVLISKDGSERPIDDSASPIRDEAGNVIGCVLVFRDVTERREAERQIRSRVEQLTGEDRRKNEFLAMLAHELRNPLAPLSNAMAILKMADGDPKLFQQTREMMERQLNQMVRLIDDLLDVSRISRGKLELRLERVALDSAIRDAMETCQPIAQASRHEIMVSLPPQPVFLLADQVRLTQIFSNLISNACKFTRPGGHIAISAAVQGAEVVVSVRDDGIGIPQDRLDDVFEMFTQLDHLPERSQGGLGIGLTLVRRLVDMHGGTVVARSEGSDRGSVFSVRLPLAPGKEPDGTAPSAPAASGAPAHRRKILVVDDNADSAESLSIYLRIGGCEVDVANDGEQALERAAHLQPDVVLLDIGLPGMSGLEVARRIRDMPWGAGATLVALTGRGEETDRHKSREAGFDHHLVKPVDPEQVARLVGHAAHS